MASLTALDWEERFTIVPNPDNGETIRDGVGAADSRTVWTVIDVNGVLYIIAGWHYVNRLGYVITEEQWTDEDQQHEWEW